MVAAGRGLLTPQGGLPEDTDLGLLVRTVLDVRLAARSLVVVERLLGQGRRDLRLLHLLPRGGVVEDLHPEGLHGLDLALTPEELVEAVTTMVVPPDAQPGRGQQIVLDGGTDAAHLPVLLRGPTVLAELTLTGPGQGEAAVPPSGEPAVPPPGEAAGAPCDGAHLVALGPGGCWAGPRPAGPRPLRLSPVPPGWVGELVGAWVRATVLPAGGTMAP